MNARTLIWVVLLIIIFTPVVVAQEDTCPTVVQTALKTVDEACAATGRNQACYGNITLTAEAQEGVEALQFDVPGDVINVADIQSLRLTGLDEAVPEWGIALMKMQANLPDTLPGQNVTMLLFGDVEIENAVETLPTADLTANTGVNVRLRPSGDGTLAGSLSRGDAVVANGRYTNSAGEAWIRIRYAEHRERTGWVIGWALSGEGVNALKVVEPTEPVLNTMQAFRFRSGSGDAECSEMPESGILVQTPKGAGTVTLRANGVDLVFGSTAFMQAVPGEYMYIYVVEGTVSATAFGIGQYVPAGTVIRIPLDDSGLASGPPEFPRPYEYDRVQTLPVTTALPEAVAVAPPLAEESVQTAVNEASGLVPRVGTWESTSPSDAYPWGMAFCDGRPYDPNDYSDYEVTHVINTYRIAEASPESLTVITTMGATWTYSVIEPGHYRLDGGGADVFVDSPTQIREVLVDSLIGCYMIFDRWIGE